MMFIRGFCRGIKSAPNFDATKPPKITAGIAVPKVNGFDGEEIIHEVVISPDQVKLLYPEKFNRLRDQMVEVPFEARNGMMNNRPWMSFACKGEPRPVIPAASAEPPANKQPGAEAPALKVAGQK